MKVEKQQAIDFLVSQGFGNAPKWDDEHLGARIAQAWKCAKPEEVGKEFSEFFKSLCDHEGEKVELTGTAKAPKPEPKREPTPKVSRPPTGEESGGGTLDEDPPHNPAPKRERSTPIDRKKEPLARSRPKKKAAKKTLRRPYVEKDRLGYRKGTLASKVNDAVTTEWQSEADLVKKAGVRTPQARVQLYQLRDAGLLEIKRIVSYRLKKKL
jgi:hypothetical protein